MNIFSIKHEEKGPIQVLSISGELDAHNTSQLEEVIKDLIDKSKYNILIDCTELDYIASAGLGVFMAHITDIRNLGGDIKFAGMNERVFNVFDLIGFTKLYTITDKMETAIDAFKIT